ncbi:MAG: TIR domain-containing protein [Myxococcales bacterium]|nr:TIR domain-containing protein [Myxococcales bacterium]MCB9715072.1 TIR domain-containing protein [Myxococcales bacterium]
MTPTHRDEIMPTARAAHSSPPLVVLFSANPSSLTRLDLEGELQDIVDELEGVGLEGVLALESQSATTPRTVQRALLVERPTVVHFSGHGRGRGARPPRRPGRAVRDLVPDPAPARTTGIMLHGDHDADLKVVSGAALGDLFAKAGSTVRLVFLNACHSAEQADALVQHVDFVIGIDGAIEDEAAKAFAVALYRALAFGRTIEASFELALNALMLEDLRDDRTRPILRCRRGADPRRARLVEPPPRDDGRAWDVFISYASADEEPVRRLAEELHHRQLRVFFDRWEIGLGEEVRQRLERGLDGCTHGLIAMSPRTMTRPWVQAEYSALLDKATTHGRLLIPVLIGRETTTLPPFLRARRLVDLRGLTTEAYRERVGDIAQALRGRRPGPPSRLRRRRTRD